MFLNANIPKLKCYVRREFLRNLEDGHGELDPVIAFGVVSKPGEALGFHVLSMEHGGVYYGVPIHALAWKDDAPARPLWQLEMWDCFSPEISVTAFDQLALRCRTLLRADGPPLAADGEYLFTIDWAHTSPEYPDTGYSMLPDEHKTAHIIQLDEGNFAALPNNRVLFAEPSGISAPFQSKPDWKINTHVWSAEREHTWATENSDRYHYSDARSEE